MNLKRSLIIGGVVLLALVGGILFNRWQNSMITDRLLTSSGAASPAISPSFLDAFPSNEKGLRPNRLIREKSPYLLQHAYNPVDWFPWGAEAFQKAVAEDKPVFLSVGYSTCYWCHVMEKESFENPEVARIMNEHFVSIKVDREERPDIDAIYMKAVQAMTGSGGWPMTVFLTPEGKPFWGGTYFPAEDKWGRPGLKNVLRSLSDAWQNRRDEVLRSSESLTKTIQATAQAQSRVELSVSTLEKAVQQMAGRYDIRYGGFHPAPKFPRSHNLSFLLRTWSRDQKPETLAMVESTLDAMARGGIHDHLGGGFHRYSTDAKWLVPHFEKMLYDQALLARTYLEAYQATGQAEYAEVARDIFEYVLRDMRDSQGAFYSAEDAGEVDKEGEFYVWTATEIKHILGAEEAKLFNRYYGVTPAGNFENATTILNVKTSLKAFAKKEGVSVEEIRVRLGASRSKLLAVRSERPRPHRDDKILTDWNGLMIGALAFGARVLDEPRYARAAQEAADFILESLERDGQLLHRYRDGQADITAFLDDHAFMAWGLLDLYEATFEARWLAQAKRLTGEMNRLFWDDVQGGFLFSGKQNEELIATTKELYDGALPSGNSVAALVLVRLGQLTMDKDLQDHAQRFFQTFSGQVSQSTSSFPQLLIALDFWLGPSQEIVIAGDPSAADTRVMIRTLHERFLPRAVFALHASDETAAAIEALVPFLKEQRAIQGKATAYVCQNYVCNLPTTDPLKMAAFLDAAR